jgi:hypothetical protein
MTTESAGDDSAETNTRTAADDNIFKWTGKLEGFAGNSNAVLEKMTIATWSRLDDVRRCLHIARCAAPSAQHRQLSPFAATRVRHVWRAMMEVHSTMLLRYARCFPTDEGTGERWDTSEHCR